MLRERGGREDQQREEAAEQFRQVVAAEAGVSRDDVLSVLRAIAQGQTQNNRVANRTQLSESQVTQIIATFPTAGCPQ